MTQRTTPQLALGEGQHVALIMDGNGRWAARRGLHRFQGHEAGVDTLRRTVAHAIDLGLRYLTVYGFSTENWRRPAPEVRALLALMRRFFISDLSELHDRGVRVRVIGERSTLDKDLREIIEEAERRTQANVTLDLIVAFNYGGHDEIVRAARDVARAVEAKVLGPCDISADGFAARLDTHAAPSPALIIRTGGEKRLSNFLLWQSAHAELAFLDVLWPDFSRRDLEAALLEAELSRAGGL